MFAVSIFAIGTALIFLAFLASLPFAMLLSVKAFKGRIKISTALLSVLILFGFGLLAGLIAFLLKVESEDMIRVIGLVAVAIGFLVVWKMVSGGFADKKVARTIGAFILYTVLSTFVLPGATAVMMAVLRMNSAQPFYVKGESMSPNFSNGEYLLVDSLSYRSLSPKRGDVVVYRYPRDKQQFFFHRVIGLPGEEVSIVDGKVLINGSELKEGYLPADLKTYGSSDGATVKLSDGQYFVLGDNRNAAKDSRSFGPLEKDLILGRAAFRGYPMDKFGVVGVVEYK